MISFDRLTVKSAEALQQAANSARKAGNPAVEDVHLLDALLSQDEGIVVPILQKRGIYRTEYEGRTFRENLGV